MYSLFSRGFPRSKRKLGAPAGFTLIEAMVVVGIIAIVVALAYPAYLDSVRKARRADAESSLLAAAQILERCFTRLNSYSAEDCPDPTGESQDGFYAITFEEDPTPTTYTLVATALGDQDNDPCPIFKLDHLGNKFPAPDPRRCWGVSGSGSS